MERITYIKSADGQEIGVVYGQIAFKMEPVEEGHFVIKSSEVFEEGKGWQQFFGSYDGDPIRSKEEFYEFVIDCADHIDEVKNLGRSTEASNFQTPWGTAQSCTHYGEGVAYYSTGIAFGFQVSRELNETIPLPLRTADGWYADMVEDSRLVIGLPDYFTSTELKQAEKEMRRDAPHLWQAHQAYLELTQSRSPGL
jgi:hypothetical protein